MASSRTNKARKRHRNAPWRMMRQAPDIGEPPAVAADAYTAAFGVPRDPSAFTAAVGSEPYILGFALARWEAERRKAAAHTDLNLPVSGWRVLSMIYPADAALSALGAGWSHVVTSSELWPSALRDALDMAVGVLVKMRQGLTVGAVIAARAFLERWTFNVASSHLLAWKQPGELDAEFISRVWDVYGLANLGRDPGRDWAWLSELQHGRVVHLGSRTLSLLAADLDQVALHAEIARIIEIPLRQVRGAIREHANASGIARFDRSLSGYLQSVAKPSEPSYLQRLLEPPDLVSMSGVDLLRGERIAGDYRVRCSEPGPETFDSVRGADAVAGLVERLSRRFENAALAATHEQELIGDRFDYGHLAARLFRYLAIAAMAEFVGSEAAGRGGEHLRLAGKALTSAWNYWLEDDDLSLPTVRVLAEQTACSRAHRLKPDKATKLASRSELPASRWFELAGWSRLSVFIRALGEFSHYGIAMRRDGAREALIALNTKDQAKEAPFGARREALDQAAYMLAHEVASRLDAMSPSLTSAFRDKVTLLDSEDHEARLSEWLELAFSEKQKSFGLPDIQRPSHDAAEHVRRSATTES